MTLLEASANGLPMISFDIETGPNEIINHGVNGLLVPSENAEEMENAINTLIRDADLRLKMSKESAESSKYFQIKKISEQWYELFCKML